jgi:hypothetical protein
MKSVKLIYYEYQITSVKTKSTPIKTLELTIKKLPKEFTLKR